MEIHNQILLLGAGFTKNFGGFLGSEMWSYIFNHKRIQEDPSLRKAVRDSFNYEALYQDIVLNKNSKISPDGKERLQEAVMDAYKELDVRLVNNIGRNTKIRNEIKSPMGHSFIEDLFCRRDKRNFIFTINQDLFFEYLYRYGTSYQEGTFHFMMPGITIKSNVNKEQRFNWPDVNFEIDDEDKVNKISLENVGNCSYIKLHGSYKFPMEMIIGLSKEELIEKYPLIRSYFNLLKDVLSCDIGCKKKLLIIGYGFRDAHINKILLDNIKNLEIYVVNPQTPETFKREMVNNAPHPWRQEECQKIWENLAGYFPYNLFDVCSYPTSPEYAYVLRYFHNR